jgi:hypothetical protein
MKHDLGFAYAQARIQARYAALPHEAEWQRLAASRTLAALLEDARTRSLRDWVKGFSSQSAARDLEAGIRSLFMEQLVQVAGWVPAPWRAAVSWVRWLLVLPLLAHLKTGGAMPRWVAGDPFVRALMGGESRLDRRRLEEGGALCLLETGGSLPELWIAEWQRRWPPCGREAFRELAELRDLLRDHVDAFRQVPPESAWPLRAELRWRLRRRFHRQALRPVVPFIYLGMLALDLERLRAALITRALFPTREEPAVPATSERTAA